MDFPVTILRPNCPAIFGDQPLRFASANDWFPSQPPQTFAVASSGTGVSRKACMSRHWIGSGARSNIVLSWTCNTLSPGVGAIAVANGGYTIIGVVAVHNGIAVQVKFSGGNTKVIASGDTDIKCDELLPSQFGVASFARDSTFDVKEIREYSNSTTAAAPAFGQAITSPGNDLTIAYNPAVVSVSNFVTTQNFWNDGNITGGVLNTDFIVANSMKESPILLGKFISGNPGVWSLVGDSKTYGTNDTIAALGACGLTRMLYPSAAAATNLTAGLNFGCSSGSAIDWATGSSKLTAYLGYSTRALEAYGTNSLNAAASQAIHAQLRAAGIPIIVRTSLTPRTTGAWTAADGSDQTLATSWGVGQAADTFEAAMRALVTTDLSYFSMDATRIASSGANYWKWFANGTPAFETADGVHQTPQGYEDSVGGNGNLITNAGGSTTSTLRAYLATLG